VLYGCSLSPERRLGRVLYILGLPLFSLWKLSWTETFLLSCVHRTDDFFYILNIYLISE